MTNTTHTTKLIGKFSQLLTMADLPLKGSLPDDNLQVIENAGVIVRDHHIVEVGNFEELHKKYNHATVEEINQDAVLLPAFIDAHTHICFAGSRANDYALRISGKSYLEIAESGGGIWDSVLKTRGATLDELVALTTARIKRQLRDGITTCEIKSGYGLSLDEEIKILEAIQKTKANTVADLVPTLLAAHILPRDFSGTTKAYLKMILNDILPVVKSKKLATRVDIFVEKSAFGIEESKEFLEKVANQNFDITVHADQFTIGGSEVAVESNAASADHLESSGELEIKTLAQSDTVAVLLPGASLGLGMPYAPARRLLDAGACVAIASDWNPGSAPMGDLLLQASVLAAYEKLSTTEVFAALTFRAAAALRLTDRGALYPQFLADLQAYPCNDYREILYQQGKLKPFAVWKNGQQAI